MLLSEDRLCVKQICKNFKYKIDLKSWCMYVYNQHRSKVFEADRQTLPPWFSPLPTPQQKKSKKATFGCVSSWMGDRLGAGIICSIRHSCPSYVKVV